MHRRVCKYYYNLQFAMDGDVCVTITCRCGCGYMQIAGNKHILLTKRNFPNDVRGQLQWAGAIVRTKVHVLVGIADEDDDDVVVDDQKQLISSVDLQPPTVGHLNFIGHY